jgi:hypothetical protein
VAEPTGGSRPPHAAHDPGLIARHAAGDLEADERARVAAIIASCVDCSLLAADLASIAAATVELGAARPARSRDYRLSAADAARLRQGDRLRRWLRPLAGRRFGFARPLGSIVIAAAIVGLLAGSLPASLGGGTGAAPVSNLASDSRELGAAGSPQAPAAAATDAFASVAATPKDRTSATSAHPGPAPTPGVTGSTAGSSIVPGSLILLVIGFGLLGGRGLARRLVGSAREP